MKINQPLFFINKSKDISNKLFKINIKINISFILSNFINFRNKCSFILERTSLWAALFKASLKSVFSILYGFATPVWEETN